MPAVQHQQHIVEHVGTEDDDAGGLLVFFAAAGIDIAHRRHLARRLVVDQFLHLRVGAQLEF